MPSLTAGKVADRAMVPGGNRIAIAVTRAMTIGKSRYLTWCSSPTDVQFRSVRRKAHANPRGFWRSTVKSLIYLKDHAARRFIGETAEVKAHCMQKDKLAE